MTAPPAPRLTFGLLPRQWLLLAATAVVVLVAQIPGEHATAWHFFHDAGRLFVGDESGTIGPGGLHLYANHPELQFGPLSIVVALPLSVLAPGAGSWAAMIALSALGLVSFALLADAIQLLNPSARTRLGRRSLVLAGILFVAVWGDVAVRTAHLDDAVALAGVAVGVWALARGRPWGAALALGVAAAAKPWALAFVPMAAAAPGRWRWVRPAVAAAIAAATWAPFVLAEPKTLDVGDYEIVNEASSALRVLGASAATTPGWVRPAQLLGGLVLATVLVARHRWSAAVMAGVAFRLLLDPAANRYYTVGLVLGILLFLLLRRPERIPWPAFAAALLLEVPQADAFPAAIAGWLRVAVAFTVLVAAFSRPVSVELPSPSGRLRPGREERHVATTLPTKPAGS